MTKRIDRVDVRASLEPQREPYWVRVAEGRFLGFRRMTKDTPGTWTARYYAGDRKYSFASLGDFKDLPEKERFDRARKAAEEVFKHLEAGGSTDHQTVKAACEAYVEHLQKYEDPKRKRTQEQKAHAAADAKARFERLVYSDPIARVDLAKLIDTQVAGWKARVLAKGGTRGSCNRNMTALRAALNLALDNRNVVSDRAWVKKLAPFEDADNSRKLYLTIPDRRKLIAKAAEEAQPLIRAMALLPLRPGDVAALRVADFDARHNLLTVPAGKTKSREIALSGETLSHVKACAKGKLPAAWIFSRTGGGQWDRFAWREHINAAVLAAKLPEATCAYSLRHAGITDMVTEGVDLFTVAALAGTSIAMIQKHYGKLQPKQVRKGLQALALK